MEEATEEEVEEEVGEGESRRRVGRSKIMFKLNVTGVAEKKKKRNSIGLSCSHGDKRRRIEEKEEEEEKEDDEDDEDEEEAEDEDEDEEKFVDKVDEDYLAFDVLSIGICRFLRRSYVYSRNWNNFALYREEKKKDTCKLR